MAEKVTRKNGMKSLCDNRESLELIRRISQVPGVPVNRLPKMVRKERALELNASCDSIAMGWKYTSR